MIREAVWTEMIQSAVARRDTRNGEQDTRSLSHMRQSSMPDRVQFLAIP